MFVNKFNYFFIIYFQLAVDLARIAKYNQRVTDLQGFLNFVISLQEETKDPSLIFIQQSAVGITTIHYNHRKQFLDVYLVTEIYTVIV